MMKERFLLAAGRIKEIERENGVAEPYGAYFRKTAVFLTLTTDTYDFVASGAIERASLAELQKRNGELYRDILPENYGESFADPAFAVKELGTEFGRLLSFLYTEMRSLISYAHEQRLEQMVIRMELFLEVYSAFICAREDRRPHPAYEEVRQIIYWFVSDYAEDAAQEKVASLIDRSRDFAIRLVTERDLSNLRYLYYYGEYVTANELETARHLLSQPESVIRIMADTYTEGYRKGFETTNKDISKKKTVNIRYCLGFERMIRAAVKNFAAMGLRPTIYRAAVSILAGKSVSRVGYYGGVPNQQYDYDHKDDQALILDKQLVNRRLEAFKLAYEQEKEAASVFGGPAVVEVFGETPPTLVSKAEALHLSDKQQKLVVEYMSAFGELQNKYIKGEERSFTIIAFPTPEVGERFPEIFDETIRINTLDYMLYRNIQQTIIDALDTGDYVVIRGMNGNRTDLKVKLHPLADGSRETNFENCVADVNIPVGEVFTSPLLTGTGGILHVSRVFLHNMEYKNLQLTIKEGRITEYSCSNFATEAENKKFIKENLLYHHETLPMGEFAIGTNTTAYVAGEKYQIADKFPILIAEKTGPHFAFGDTCYSHAEEIAVYNPDGKEMIARDNEISLLRKEDTAKAYFNCHTDITIPYHELGEVSAVTHQGQIIPIIKEGRFVLPGCEELNKPFVC